MNILILEDEIYLAQKISNELEEIGYKTYVHTSFDDIDKNIKYDTVLLSTSLQVGDTKKIIQKLKDSVIVLLVSYINDITVTKPIEAGAVDYILKPFLIKDLIRKIEHFYEYKTLKKESYIYNKFLDFSFEDVEEKEFDMIFPFLLESSSKSWINKAIFNILNKTNLDMEYYDASVLFDEEINIKFQKNKLYIFNNADIIKDWLKVIDQFHLNDYKVIFCSLSPTQNFPYKKIVYKKNRLDEDTILTINEYIKMIVLSHQDKLTDIEISKRLGISRKSLWDKRRKMGIEKRKKDKI